MAPRRPKEPEPAAGPEEEKTQAAIKYYQEALKDGPRLAREVMDQGIRQGHARRTQERARNRLNVQSWPTTFQGPRLIALPDSVAAKEVKQRRQNRKQQGKGNGRRKKGKNGGGRRPRNGLLASMR